MHQLSAFVYIQISEYDFKILSSHGVHESAFAKPSLPHHHQRELKPPLHRLSVHLSIRKGLKLIDLRSFWSINKAGHLIGKVCKTNIAIKLSRRFSHWLALRRDNSFKLKSKNITSGFGDTSLGLGESSGFLGPECEPTPLVSLVLSWDSAS